MNNLLCGIVSGFRRSGHTVLTCFLQYNIINIIIKYYLLQPKVYKAKMTRKISKICCICSLIEFWAGEAVYIKLKHDKYVYVA